MKRATRKPASLTAAERRVVRAADVLALFLIGLKIQWTGVHGGPHYFVPPHRVRPLVNACAALERQRKAGRKP